MKKALVILLSLLLLTACEEKTYPSFTGELTEVKCEPKFNSSKIIINNSYKFGLDYESCENLLVGIPVIVHYNENLHVTKLELVDDGAK